MIDADTLEETEADTLEETEADTLIDLKLDILLIGEYVIAEVGLGVLKGLLVVIYDSVLIGVIDKVFVGVLDGILVGELVGLLETVIILLGEFSGLLEIVFVLLDDILSDDNAVVEYIKLFEFIGVIDISELLLIVAIIDSVLIGDTDGILVEDTIGEYVFILLCELYELTELLGELDGTFDTLIVLLVVIDSVLELEPEPDSEAIPDSELINVLVIVGIIEAVILGD